MSSHPSLPPLPDRAITGLPRPWRSPIGEQFHTVQLWEFPLLFVVLKQKMWARIAKFLKSYYNLAALAQEIDVSRSILANIRDNPHQSIKVPYLQKIAQVAEIDLDEIVQTIHFVRFNQSGDPEYITFPFTMDLYAWRVICHIFGDGNVGDKNKNHRYPFLRWTQWPRKKDKLEYRNKELPPRTQRFMRGLIEKLSRLPTGKGKSVYYPKALSYAIMGTIPNFTLRDLRKLKFIQFVIDLPPDYRDYKVQFLVAFSLDDGGIDQSINLFQSSPQKLKLISKLCDQLGYKTSDNEYLHKRDDVWSFRILLRGVRDFYNDINDIQSSNNCDPLLGLWYKSTPHKKIVENISDERLDENQRAIEVYTCILTLMANYQVWKAVDLKNNIRLAPLIKDYSDKIFGDRLRWLTKNRFIKEVKQTDGRSYRPKRWRILPFQDLKALIQQFHISYADRSHEHSQDRKPVTTELVVEILEKFLTDRVKPSPIKIAREGGFSRQAFYRRPELMELLNQYKKRFEDQYGRSL